MKKLYLILFLISFILISSGKAQWWVDGGNLIWPYGDVSITKGDLIIGDQLQHLNTYKVFLFKLDYSTDDGYIESTIYRNDFSPIDSITTDSTQHVMFLYFPSGTFPSNYSFSYFFSNQDIEDQNGDIIIGAYPRLTKFNDSCFKIEWYSADHNLIFPSAVLSIMQLIQTPNDSKMLNFQDYTTEPSSW